MVIPKVIYSDEEVLVLEKPPGLVVDPADSVKTETLADILQKEFKIPLFRGGIVHRLDKDTSGLILVAKTQEALENLQSQFKERIVKKEYLALVHGLVEKNGKIEGNIGRNPGNREKFTVLEEGKEAVTEYEPVKNVQLTMYNLQLIFPDFNKIQMRKLEKQKYGEFTLLRCKPQTGRTHQIRVHLKYINFPIVSDEKYVGRKMYRLDKRWCPRLFLHAEKIGFKHPVSGEWMEFKSPLPEDLKHALDNYMNSIFLQLAIILIFASALGLIVYKFKLPLLIAYLTTGVLLSAAVAFDLSNSSALSFLPDIGIAFVLFLVGMELDLREIKNLGKQILTAGILQVIITATLGTFIAQSFGFKTNEAILLGIGLSFSSTLVVIKLLLDKKDLTSLYGKLSVGILLLEDLIAVLILLGMSSSMSFSNFSGAEIFPIGLFLIKVIALFAIAVLINRYILSAVFKIVSDSGELLFLTALAWCFGFISLAMIMGFSVMIGAFLAGVALASSLYHFQIQGKIKPMRDFFTALFFVYLGTKVNFSPNLLIYPLILIFSLYAVFIKPIIFLLLFGIFGFRKHTMFQAALNLSQVSEFSLIILLVGFKNGLVGQDALTVIALSSVISFIVSSLMISSSDKIYKLISSTVSFFERRKELILENEPNEKLVDHVVVVGAHRVGGEIVRVLKREKYPLVVLDFNPHQVEKLLKEEIPVIYGDVSDPDILDVLNLDSAKIIISTSPDIEGNKTLLEDLKLRHINIPKVVRAETIKEAQGLYKLGADLVIIPEVMAGDMLVDTLLAHLSEKSYFKDRPRIELEKLSRKTLSWG